MKVKLGSESESGKVSKEQLGLTAGQVKVKFGPENENERGNLVSGKIETKCVPFQAKWE